MEKTNLSVNKETRPVKKEDEASPSSKTPINENPVKELIDFDKMSEDTSVLFSHFPEEIWKLITDKVTDSESLVNLTQASPVFQNILLKRRTEFLFPQVWKVLGVKFERQEDEVYSYNVDKMYPDRDLSRFPNGKTPWCSRILTLRLVCKSWCDGVDKFYEDLTRDHQTEMSEDSCNYNSRGKRMGEWTHTVMSSHLRSTWESFINHFRPTHLDGGNKRNPIIGRHISMDLSDYDWNSGAEGEIFNLLSKYGHHFWFCDLSLSSVFDTGVDFYIILKEVMELSPNLKTLYVKFGLIPEHRNFQHVIDDHPLPKLNQLEFLSVGDLPTSIFNALVSVNSHISMLEAPKGVVSTFRASFDIYSFPMPNLKQLSMQHNRARDFHNLIRPDVNWVLEKIYLLSHISHALSRFQIFYLLECKWGTTLTNVAISFPPNNRRVQLDNNALKYDLSLRLNLPKVQRLKVEFRDVSSLDFILPMQSLVFLEVALVVKDLSNIESQELQFMQDNQIVQFVGFFGRFHESNIWNLLPNLKSIQIFDANYMNAPLEACTRKDFETKGKTNAADGPTTSSGKSNLWVYRST